MCQVQIVCKMFDMCWKCCHSYRKINKPFWYIYGMSVRWGTLLKVTSTTTTTTSNNNKFSMSLYIVWKNFQFGWKHAIGHTYGGGVCVSKAILDSCTLNANFCILTRVIARREWVIESESVEENKRKRAKNATALWMLIFWLNYSANIVRLQKICRRIGHFQIGNSDEKRHFDTKRQLHKCFGGDDDGGGGNDEKRWNCYTQRFGRAIISSTSFNRLIVYVFVLCMDV